MISPSIDHLPVHAGRRRCERHDRTADSAVRHPPQPPRRRPGRHRPRGGQPDDPGRRNSGSQCLPDAAGAPPDTGAGRGADWLCARRRHPRRMRGTRAAPHRSRTCCVPKSKWRASMHLRGRSSAKYAARKRCLTRPSHSTQTSSPTARPHRLDDRRCRMTRLKVAELTSGVGARPRRRPGCALPSVVRTGGRCHRARRRNHSRLWHVGQAPVGGSEGRGERAVGDNAVLGLLAAAGRRRRVPDRRAVRREVPGHSRHNFGTLLRRGRAQTEDFGPNERPREHATSSCCYVASSRAQ